MPFGLLPIPVPVDERGMRPADLAAALSAGARAVIVTPRGQNPTGDPTLIDTLRRIVADRQHAKIDGVLIDLWSASVTVLIWDNLRDDKRQRLLRLPSHELILRCVRIYTHLTTRRGDR